MCIQSIFSPLTFQYWLQHSLFKTVIKYYHLCYQKSTSRIWSFYIYHLIYLKFCIFKKVLRKNILYYNMFEFYFNKWKRSSELIYCMVLISNEQQKVTTVGHPTNSSQENSFFSCALLISCVLRRFTIFIL